jgi:biofilm PGA synthesis N-glycosyltransferase PgaC
VRVVAIVFWVCAGLIAYAQAGYGLLLAVLARLRGAAPPAPPAPADDELPSVSVIVAAYQEEAVIAI